MADRKSGFGLWGVALWKGRIAGGRAPSWSQCSSQGRGKKSWAKTPSSVDLFFEKLNYDGRAPRVLAKLLGTGTLETVLVQCLCGFACGERRQTQFLH